MKKTYEVKYNNCGIVHIIAPDFSAAEKAFLKSGYGGENVIIKSISILNEFYEPLISQEELTP